MKHRAVLVWVYLLCRHMTAAVICNPAEYGAPDKQKPMPDLYDYTSGTYQAIFDGSFFNEKKTLEILEFKSWPLKSGTLLVTEKGTWSWVVYNTNSGQMFLIRDKVCNLVDMKNPPFPFWGWIDGKNEDYIYGPSAMLRMFKDVDKNYIGQSQVRGITADNWQICVENGKVKVDIYYAADTWDTAFGSASETLNLKTPLRIKIASVKSLTGSTASGDIYHATYDIADFLPYVSYMWIMFTPVRLDCPGRINIDPNRKLPTIPNHFQVMTEFIINSVVQGEHSENTVIQEVDNTRLWYNKEHKIIRYDFTPKKVKPPLHNKDPVSFIQDFNTGTEYIIDLFHGTCSLGPIEESTIGAHLGVNHQITMASPEEMFHMDEEFSFLGTTEIRGLHAEMWTAIVSGIQNPLNNDVYDKANIIYYFTEFGVEDEVSGTKSTHIPLRSDIFMYNNSNPYQDLLSVTSNLYDYVTAPKGKDRIAYEVRACFPNEEERKFVNIVFPGNFDDGVKEDPFPFKASVLNLMIMYGSLSPVRIAEINLDHDEKYIYVTCLLLEKASYLSEFHIMLTDQNPPGANELVIPGMTNAESCAKACINQKLFYCKSFHFCKDRCFLSKIHGQDGQPVQDVDSHTCWHFDRNTDDGSSNDLPSAIALINIAKAVANREFQVTLSYLIGEEPTSRTFVATDVHVYVPPDADPYKYMFYQWYSAGSLTHPEAAAKTDFDECAKRCATQLAFDCNSFSYCLESKMCAMSSSHPEQLPADGHTSQGQCLLYGKNYLLNFEVFPGGVTLQSSDKEVHGVAGTEACARLCEKETSFRCRSFEYCATESRCALHKVHFLGTSSGEQVYNTSCTHYSRKPLADYKRQKHQRLGGQEHSKLAGNMGTAACANLCSEQSGFTCQSFDTCSGCMYPDTCDDEERQRAECYLNDADLGDDGVVLEEDSECDHYSRNSIDGLDMATWLQQNSSGNDGYSSGSMAGLAIGMLIAGFLLTVGGIGAYLHHSGKL